MPFGQRVLDSAYSAMMAAIASDRAPHFVCFTTSREAWRVMDLLLIPRFAIPKSAIEKRKPLSSKARRAGWVGCNIMLTQIPEDARLSMCKMGLLNSRRLCAGDLGEYGRWPSLEPRNAAGRWTC